MTREQQDALAEKPKRLGGLAKQLDLASRPAPAPCRGGWPEVVPKREFPSPSPSRRISAQAC